MVHRRAERQRGRAPHAEGRHRREAAPRRPQADPELGKIDSNLTIDISNN